MDFSEIKYAFESWLVKNEVFLFFAKILFDVLGIKIKLM